MDGDAALPDAAAPNDQAQREMTPLSEAPNAAEPDDQVQREVTPLSEASHTGDHPPAPHPAEYCWICLNSVKKGSYIAFLEHHNLLSAWELCPTSEHQRWWVVVEASYEIYQGCLQNELRIVELAFWFRNRAPRRAEQTDEHKRMRQRIEDAAESAVQCNAQRRQNNERHKKIPLDDSAGTNPSFSNWYVWANPLDGTRVTFRVATALAMQESRWYLGRNPGTFIFRFSRHPSVGSGLNSFMGYVDGSLVDEEDFTFVGQIPRPKDQLLLRVRQLRHPLIQLFVSAIEFGSGRDHRKLLPELQNLLHRERWIGDEFQTIFKLWVDRYPADNPPGRVLRKEFTDHRIVRETAHLLIRLGMVESPLASLLTLATLQSVHQLAGLFQDQLEDEAWDKLFSENNRDVLIYDGHSADLYDIHEFYRQPRFTTDPCNATIAFANAGSRYFLEAAQAYKLSILP
ncbi:hypothetical protein ACJ41O_001110 [Fusarium nematophilum]